MLPDEGRVEHGEMEDRIEDGEGREWGKVIEEMGSGQKASGKRNVTAAV